MKTWKATPDNRASASQRGPEVVSESPDEAADAAREARENEITGEFLAASGRLIEVMIGRLEEARREGAEFTYHPGIDREIAELKNSNASIRKLIGLLEILKKLQIKRLGDLGWILDQFGPGRRRGR